MGVNTNGEGNTIRMNGDSSTIITRITNTNTTHRSSIMAGDTSDRGNGDSERIWSEKWTNGSDPTFGDQDLEQNKKSELSKQQQQQRTTVRSLWRQRHARSAEEGIRRERTYDALSSVLEKAQDSIQDERRKQPRYRSSSHYAARTITGLINALAEEVADLQVKARSDTPFWNKHVDEISIQFSRLAFKPLQISEGVLKHSLLRGSN